jgi:hypothetical protein
MSDPPFPPVGRISPPRVVVLFMAGVVLAMVAVLVWLALAVWVLHGPVNGPSLQRSVELAADSASLSPGGCRPRADRAWRCVVDDSGSSGVVRYDVRVRAGSSCWDARLLRADGEPMPRRVSGCVHRWQPSVLAWAA